MRKVSEPTATHTGWFLFCPVYLAFEDKNDSEDGPVVWARWSILEPLLALAGWIQGLAITVLSATRPDYEPAFMFSRVQKIGQHEDGGP